MYYRTASCFYTTFALHTKFGLADIIRFRSDARVLTIDNQERRDFDVFQWGEGPSFLLRACGSCLPFFPPKTAPKSKVWRGHLRRGSQDFIDYINGLGNFRGISGLIHPDQAVFHWEFWICQFFWIFPPPSAAQMQCSCFPAIRIRSANQRIENKNKSES